jgi:hypothetical protein
LFAFPTICDLICLVSYPYSAAGVVPVFRGLPCKNRSYFRFSEYSGGMRTHRLGQRLGEDLEHDSYLTVHETVRADASESEAANWLMLPMTTSGHKQNAKMRFHTFMQTAVVTNCRTLGVFARDMTSSQTSHLRNLHLRRPRMGTSTTEMQVRGVLTLQKETQSTGRVVHMCFPVMAGLTATRRCHWHTADTRHHETKSVVAARLQYE